MLFPYAYNILGTAEDAKDAIQDVLYKFLAAGKEEIADPKNYLIRGVINQSIPPGGPVPPGFLTTVNSFTTNIASPAAFNPINSNVSYIPPDTRWPYVETWLLSIQREVVRRGVMVVGDDRAGRRARHVGAAVAAGPDRPVGDAPADRVVAVL